MVNYHNIKCWDFNKTWAQSSVDMQSNSLIENNQSMVKQVGAAGPPFSRTSSSVTSHPGQHLRGIVGIMSSDALGDHLQYARSHSATEAHASRKVRKAVMKSWLQEISLVASKRTLGSNRSYDFRATAYGVDSHSAHVGAKHEVHDPSR